MERKVIFKGVTFDSDVTVNGVLVKAGTFMSAEWPPEVPTQLPPQYVWPPATWEHDAAIRAAALEEAARLCYTKAGLGFSPIDCAKAIRALKEEK